MGVSYINAGEEQLNIAKVVCKIGEIFNTKEIILGGGGSLTWFMLCDGLCDEISLAIVRITAGEIYSAPLLMGFTLTRVELLEERSVEMRYRVDGSVNAPTR